MSTTVVIPSFRLGSKPGKARVQKLTINMKLKSAMTQHPTFVRLPRLCIDAVTRPQRERKCQSAFFVERKATTLMLFCNESVDTIVLARRQVPNKT